MPSKSKAVTAKAAPKSKSAQKQGGAIVQDLQNLAVPFGILLAKKGLDMAVEKKANNAKPAQAQNASQTAKANNAPAQTAKNTKQNAKSGGAAKSVRKEMDALSNEIERYLKKY